MSTGALKGIFIIFVQGSFSWFDSQLFVLNGLFQTLFHLFCYFLPNKYVLVTLTFRVTSSSHLHPNVPRNHKKLRIFEIFVSRLIKIRFLSQPRALCRFFFHHYFAILIFVVKIVSVFVHKFVPGCFARWADGMSDAKSTTRGIRSPAKKNMRQCVFEVFPCLGSNSFCIDVL